MGNGVGGIKNEIDGDECDHGCAVDKKHFKGSSEGGAGRRRQKQCEEAKEGRG